ncbi:putative membrane transporter protein YfcA [Dyadobacter sp. CECT 9623]|uniref:Probable membrane transporter protein n=1 Tax=Dyadobacter linearis TaxID=2823330 RepID=A0ABM8UNH9_9BACT|nr:TSUP family transporter [Dyadobacter sp. CECT 9623]CAG5069005.1 putative membrane transporter protein YfcA [Dyadobacter sp. CECT 9623]
MDLSSFTTDYSFALLVALSSLAFVAGFIDAVVGGGGLIQIPALLIAFPDKAVATLFGTNKIAAISGTSVAAYNYSKRIRFDYRLLIVVSLAAFTASFLGAKVVSMVRAEVLRPVILIILVIMLIYVYTNKNLGAAQNKGLPLAKQLVLGSLIGLVVGFYDGFFGPGTGSFLILGFVVLLRFDFVTASGYAKLINCVTNISALLVFIRNGNFLLGIGITMAVFNIAGNIIGSRMALREGNGFVRKIFLVVVSLMILRYGYDVFQQFLPNSM